jgi:hypothetical protein
MRFFIHLMLRELIIPRSKTILALAHNLKNAIMQCIKNLKGNDFERSLRDFLKMTLSNKIKITKIFGQKKIVRALCPYY